MQKTLLEAKLEQTLQELGMPLKPRVYTEELDIQAELEYLTSDIQPTDNLYDKIGKVSEAQLDYGDQPYYIRRSAIHNGLAYKFSLERHSIDCSILYDAHFKSIPLRSERFSSIGEEKFFNKLDNNRLTIAINALQQICIINLAHIIGYEGYEILRRSFEKIDTLNEKPFTEQRANELMQYIRELKQAADAS
ncbi:MAG: hypothetical protein RL557_44 [archaeon]|jgi:hypothetical protein